MIQRYHFYIFVFSAITLGLAFGFKDYFLAKNSTNHIQDAYVKNLSKSRVELLQERVHSQAMELALLPGIGFTLKKSRLVQTKSLLRKLPKRAARSSDFIYFYDFKGEFLYSPQPSRVLSPKSFVAVAGDTMAIRSPVQKLLIFGNQICICSFVPVVHRNFKQGLAVVGNFLGGHLKDILSSSQYKLEIHINRKGLRSGPTSKVNASLKKFTVNLAPGIVLVGLAKIADPRVVFDPFPLFLGVIFSVIYVVLCLDWQKFFMHHQLSSLQLIAEGFRAEKLSMPRGLSKSFHELAHIGLMRLSAANDEAVRLRDELALSQSQLDKVSELAKMKGWELSTYLSKIQKLTEEYFADTTAYSSGQVVDADRFFAGLIQKAAILSNYSRLYSIDNVTLLAKSMLDVLTKHRNSGKAIDQQLVDSTEEKIYEILFEIDAYLTVREIRLGNFINDSRLTYITHLQQSLIRSNLLDCIPKVSNTDFFGDMAFLFYDNLMDYLPQYNSLISRVSGERGLLVGPIQVMPGSLFIDRDSWIYVNEAIMQVLLFFVEACLEKPTVRHSNGRPSQGTVFIDLKRQNRDFRLDLELDSNALDLKSLEESAIKRSLVQHSEIASLSFFDRWAKLAFLPGVFHDLVGVGDHLVTVKDLMASIGGQVDIQLGATRASISVAWQQKEQELPNVFSSLVTVLAPVDGTAELAKILSRLGVLDQVTLLAFEDWSRFVQNAKAGPALAVINMASAVHNDEIKSFLGVDLTKIFVCEEVSHREDMTYSEIEGRVWAIRPQQLEAIIGYMLGVDYDLMAV